MESNLYGNLTPESAKGLARFAVNVVSFFRALKHPTIEQYNAEPRCSEREESLCREVLFPMVEDFVSMESNRAALLAGLDLIQAAALFYISPRGEDVERGITGTGCLMKNRGQMLVELEAAVDRAVSCGDEKWNWHWSVSKFETRRRGLESALFGLVEDALAFQKFAAVNLGICYLSAVGARDASNFYSWEDDLPISHYPIIRAFIACPSRNDPRKAKVHCATEISGDSYKLAQTPIADACDLPRVVFCRVRRTGFEGSMRRVEMRWDVIQREVLLNAHAFGGDPKNPSGILNMEIA
tara:strand:- start:67 stop:957 length:891 start_codon:yes stop_codon:yes gene_type:complete